MATKMTQKDEATNINPPQRWAQKDGKDRKTGDFGTYRTQKAGFPCLKLASWISKNPTSAWSKFN